MKRHRQSPVIIVLVALLALTTVGVSASNFYIIPDSDRRELKASELWEWQYDALGYIFNEIFARHGYPFDPGGSYDRWFSRQTWYRKNPVLTKSECYNRLSNLEWRNEQLVKQVRQQMRDMGTRNPKGKALPNLEPDLFNIPDLFEEYLFTPGQRLAVYTGPGTGYLRAAAGKAMTSTNGTVYVAGWDQGWLMVLYRTNNGGARIGFVDGPSIKGGIYADRLSFEYQDARVVSPCPITDDPVGSYAPLATLRAGDRVTYLTALYNREAWAYVEAWTSAGLLRGCIPFSALDFN